MKRKVGWKIMVAKVAASAVFLGAIAGLSRWTSAAGEQPRAARREAPDLVGTSWLNVGSSSIPSLRSRRGKVTIVHFWTFGCINCKRNLPLYNRWVERLKGSDVAVIGIHTPESDYERNRENLRREIERQDIRYPVLIDNEGTNWRNWQQRYWPTVYLVDKKGLIRYVWEGELAYNGAGGEQTMLRLADQLRREDR